LELTDFFVFFKFGINDGGLGGDICGMGLEIADLLVFKKKAGDIQVLCLTQVFLAVIMVFSYMSSALL
jgi:hypothetical protein